jgi:hypothetical protein
MLFTLRGYLVTDEERLVRPLSSDNCRAPIRNCFRSRFKAVARAH